MVKQRWSTWVALGLLITGAWLRLHRLDAMEFKSDEQDALNVGIRLLDDRPWSSPSPWPTHGMLSSNGVPNAPLFNWIVAAAWATTRDPVGVGRLIALANALCLYPLWRWARRRTSEGRALLTLGVAAVSPFAVLFSRKIWTQDLLLPGVLALLWGIEWLRSERPWRGVTLLVLAALLVGQLHQSGAIGMILLPVAIGVQHVLDRRRGAVSPWGPPSSGELVAIAVALGLNLFFWFPYLNYLARLPAGWLAGRPTLAVVTPALLLRVEAQVIPVDLFAFFDPDRSDFLRSAVRALCYRAAVGLGAPLLVYGLWRWLRSPLSIPVFGLWWWGVIIAFTLARIPSHPFYVLTLAPLPAVLAAGAFDPPMRRAWVARALAVWRVAYTAALLGLTVVTESWLVDRGGAAGDYGISYSRRQAQAETIVRGLASQAPGDADSIGELRRGEDRAGLTCGPVPAEVSWIVRWLDHTSTAAPTVRICDGWIDQADRLEYRWTVRE